MDWRWLLVQHDKVFSLVSLDVSQSVQSVLRSYAVALNLAMVEYEYCEVGFLSQETHEMVTHRFKGDGGLLFIHLLLPSGVGYD